MSKEVKKAEKKNNKIKKQKQIRLRRGFDVSDGDEMKHYLLKEICQHISKKYNKDIDLKYIDKGEDK